MIDEQHVVAIVPARGGSKTLPGKNIKNLGGKPLIAWAIETANETEEIDRIIVSTDDTDIADVATEYGAEVLERPTHLATDDALVIDTIRHTIAACDLSATAEYVVMLEPTSPLRTSTDIKRCLDRLSDEDEEYDSVATFTDAELNPHRVWQLTEDDPEPYLPEADPWQPRQQLPDAYQLTGAVYAFRTDAVTEEGTSLLFGNAGAVLMPQRRAVDIDTELDFQLAEQLLPEVHNE
ncbi:cytidylyltransferase domain-containing protein [Natrialbaceae archaeon A-CW1-1]